MQAYIGDLNDGNTYPIGIITPADVPAVDAALHERGRAYLNDEVDSLDRYDSFQFTETDKIVFWFE